MSNKKYILFTILLLATQMYAMEEQQLQTTTNHKTVPALQELSGNKIFMMLGNPQITPQFKDRIIIGIKKFTLPFRLSMVTHCSTLTNIPSIKAAIDMLPNELENPENNLTPIIINLLKNENITLFDKKSFFEKLQEKCALHSEIIRGALFQLNLFYHNEYYHRTYSYFTLGSHNTSFLDSDLIFDKNNMETLLGHNSSFWAPYLTGLLLQTGKAQLPPSPILYVLEKIGRIEVMQVLLANDIKVDDQAISYAQNQYAIYKNKKINNESDCCTNICETTYNMTSLEYWQQVTALLKNNKQEQENLISEIK